MPTNGLADGILYTVNGAPVFTYGMITLTAVVLAYMTFMDDSDIPNPVEPNPITDLIPPVGAPIPPPSTESIVPLAVPEPAAEESLSPMPVPGPMPVEEALSPTLPEESPSNPEEVKTQGGKRSKKRKTRRIR